GAPGAARGLRGRRPGGAGVRLGSQDRRWGRVGQDPGPGRPAGPAAGYPVGDETCELVGYGPVAVSALHDMIDTGDPFLAAVVTKGQEVLGVAHLGRRPTAHQRSALEWLNPECTVLGCGVVSRLEIDHRV